MVATASGPRVPGSEHIPFKPFNAHGKSPKIVGANGQTLDWKNPLAEPLFQVFVEDRERGYIAIGPKMGQAVADQFLAATKLAIKSGKISGWSNPHVISAGRQRAVSRVF